MITDCPKPAKEISYKGMTTAQHKNKYDAVNPLK